ncbi:hypothetical protein PR202_gb22892 [Eleusine coracana subsp. coracana]|uniref:NB-ARC domain-containing protein n=1 Tax=Eleusine coracana subsp. coracana TaxID=191504 RepID=A0AAV5FIX1_ELECO|nr:hypothetical protein PR202_gb22892 [Eleusine coracana subsp. coracana]
MLGFSKCSPRRDKADEEQEEQKEKRGVLWPCCGASAITPPATPASQQSDRQEVGDGCISRLASSARDTIHAVGKHPPCCSVSLSPAQIIHANANTSSGRSRPNKAPQRKPIAQAPKLKFDRVKASRKMREIIEQLKPLCAKVSTILNLDLLDSNRSIAHCIATTLDPRNSGKQWHKTLPPAGNAISRPITTSEPINIHFYGRDSQRNKIISNITEGEYHYNDFTVLTIDGQGGIGKTTLMQHIYNDPKVETHFDLKLWECVSIDFNVDRLTKKIAQELKSDDKARPDAKLIAEKLHSKRFLLVLDDMWSCSNEDEWEKFLIPFKKGQTKGNAILVTTRIPQLAKMVQTTGQYEDLEGLDPKAFTELFYSLIFGDKQPPKDHEELLRIGDLIKQKLKGNPLAAKTVGRLLRSHIDLDHWTRVLESKEWVSQNGENAIMPALKLSFDYLPFHLQHCFIYCALFPEDYKFGEEELIHFWIGLDVLHSHGENKTIEEIGQSYLTELTDHGFLKMEEDEKRPKFFVIHDLLHELALKVSALECLSIYSSTVRSVEILPSIRHLSIHIDDTSVRDRKNFDICREDFGELGKRLKVENLRSLMLFGSDQEGFVKTLNGLFSQAKALRVVLLSCDACYSTEELLQNFSELVHLRYFRTSIIAPPNSISRSYHLRVLDTQGCFEWDDFPRDMSNLVKLRHFIVRHGIMHTNLSKLGRLKSLQQLRRFVVKKEAHDFELREIGKLLELRGSLWIGNLERVEVQEEAEEAKLMQKTHLHKLELEWDINRSNKDAAREKQVLEGFTPSSKLSELCIIGHGGGASPSWLGANLLIEGLKSLGLKSVDWQRFPPIGEFWLVNEHGDEYPSPSNTTSNQNFRSLKRIELTKLKRLRKWVARTTSELFTQLEILIIEDCPEFVELSFSVCNCSQQERKTTWFPNLQELVIRNCPKFSYLPLIPWTSDHPCSVKIERVILSGFMRLKYEKDYYSGLSLDVVGNDAQDSAWWMAMDFNNLTKLVNLRMERCPPVQLDRLQMLSCLKTMQISNLEIPFWPVEEKGSYVQYNLPCECITIERIGANGKRLTQLLSYMPKLSKLVISKCEKITGLGVEGQQKKAQSSSSQVEATIGQHQQLQNSKEEELVAEGLLLLPPQLQELEFSNLPELMLLRPDSVDNSKGGGKGGGLQGLCSLRSLRIWKCPKFLSSYLSASSSSFPFPTSLQTLVLSGVEGMETMAPLSNLTSLIELEIREGGDLRGEGLCCLLAQGCLTHLIACCTPNFFGGSVPSELHEHQGPSFGSPKLQSLQVEVDGIEGFLDARICRFLSSSLTKLLLQTDEKIERFTTRQEEALQLLTSLQQLRMRNSYKLQYLPQGLSRLPNLRELYNEKCPAVCSFPDLPDSLQELEITECPSIRTLPKSGLQRSLRVLDVEFHNNEELQRQCRKLTGTIPIVLA